MLLLTKPLIKTTWPIRFFIWFGAILIGFGLLLLMFIVDTKNVIYQASSLDSTNFVEDSLPAFPIGVDPITEVITENPDVDNYMNKYVAVNHTTPNLQNNWFEKMLAKLSDLDWYQNLATPATRILIIQSGERKEEVAKNFSRILHWNTDQTATFIKHIDNEVPTTKDGKLYPGRYIVTNDASPETVAVAVAERFNAEVRTRYTDDISKRVPLNEALIVASLIEREAYDFDDMRYISGIIWNRLFTGMKLQIDATLQYAKGAQTASVGGKWWTVPVPSDKKIDSPYNTYMHDGLPPDPIANPSIEAIVAALNPRNTDCLFYFHDNNGTFYCNNTYEEHLSDLKQVFDLK
jgi:UPF0755 protein